MALGEVDAYAIIQARVRETSVVFFAMRPYVSRTALAFVALHSLVRITDAFEGAVLALSAVVGFNEDFQPDTLIYPRLRRNN